MLSVNKGMIKALAAALATHRGNIRENLDVFHNFMMNDTDHRNVGPAASQDLIY